MDFNKISGWASIIGIPLAVFLSWIFFELGQEEQEPIFLEDYQARTVLIDKENTSQAPISILDEQSNRVKGDVVSTKFYFWNNGEKPILFEEDVLERADTGKKEILVAIFSPEEASRILKFDCPIKTNQEYTGFEVSQTHTNAISIRFKVMRQFEGITCQIIFEGNQSSVLGMQGSLLGETEDIGFNSSFEKIRWIAVRKSFNDSLRFFLIALFLSSSFYVFLSLVLVLIKSFRSESMNWTKSWQEAKPRLSSLLKAAVIISFGTGMMSFIFDGTTIFWSGRGITFSDVPIPTSLLSPRSQLPVQSKP